MSTSLGLQARHSVGAERINGSDDDPFKTPPQSQQSHPHPHRFSSFDTHLFALNHPSSSPSQAKRALEAHMVETERRLQETSKLGTALLQQKKHLSERLQEVETQQEDGEISSELRQKLVDIEKDYTEVGRASARAFLGPKTDGPGSGGSINSPFALDGKVSRFCSVILVIAKPQFSVPQVHQNFRARLRTLHRSSMFPGSNEINPQIEWVISNLR